MPQLLGLSSATVSADQSAAGSHGGGAADRWGHNYILIFIFLLGSYLNATGVPLPPGPPHAPSLQDTVAGWVRARNLPCFIISVSFEVWGRTSKNPGCTKPCPPSHPGDTTIITIAKPGFQAGAVGALLMPGPQTAGASRSLPLAGPMPRLQPIEADSPSPHQQPRAPPPHLLP